MERVIELRVLEGDAPFQDFPVERELLWLVGNVLLRSSPCATSRSRMDCVFEEFAAVATVVIGVEMTSVQARATLVSMLR